MSLEQKLNQLLWQVFLLNKQIKQIRMKKYGNMWSNKVVFKVLLSLKTKSYCFNQQLLNYSFIFGCFSGITHHKISKLEVKSLKIGRSVHQWWSATTRGLNFTWIFPFSCVALNFLLCRSLITKPNVENQVSIFLVDGLGLGFGKFLSV